MLLDGEPVDFDQRRAGAGGRHRVHPPGADLFSQPDVAENVFLGASRRRGLGRDRPAARCTRERAALLERLGLDIDPDAPVGGLSIAQQQMVEIAKALSLDARVIIMDEPTAR